MRILSWNIRQGGGARLPRIVDAIARHHPDIVIVNETRARTEPQLIESLGAIGLSFSVSSAPTGTEYGLVVAGRVQIEADVWREPIPKKLLPHGILEVSIPSAKLTIGAVYGPMLSPAHDPYWRALARRARQRLPERYLLIGDFNSGESFVDTERYKFKRADLFLALKSLGFVDAWRAEHGDKREYTWYSFGKGNVRVNGFRLDHALASPSFAAGVAACRYSHDERDERLSDHSVLLLDFEPAAPNVSESAVGPPTSSLAALPSPSPSAFPTPP
jgi:exodeoxyribonuclease III